MTQNSAVRNTTIKDKVIQNRVIIFSSCLFVILLCLFCFVNNSLEKYSPSTIQLFNRITANVVSGTLNLIRIKSIPSGGTINIRRGGALQIIYECTGIYVFLIFIAFVLSYPALIHQKLLGLAVFIPILYLFNVFRIASLAVIQLHWPQYLDMVHKYLWEATFMVLVMAMTYLWLLWIGGQMQHSSRIDDQLRHVGSEDHQGGEGHQLSGRFRRCGNILKAAVEFILYSCLGYGLLMVLYRPYLFFLKSLVNTGLSVSWKYWLDYWPMRLMIENKELWLIYGAGKSQIPDAPFLVPNLIPFVSLMLVTRLRPRIKALGITLGSVILCGYHVFTLILVIQKLACRWLYLYTFFRVYLLFLLPIILWLPFFLSSREKKRKDDSLSRGANRRGAAGEANQKSAAGRERERSRHRNSSAPEGMGWMEWLPGDTAGWKIFYAVLGIILPVIILLFGNEPGPGYYLGFFLWLTGLVLILPKSTFLTGANLTRTNLRGANLTGANLAGANLAGTKGRKRTFALILLYALFWQGPLTANSLIYVPAGKRALFLKSVGQPASCAEEGLHLSSYLAQKPILFDLHSREILIQIGARVKEEDSPLIAADLEVRYQLSRNSDLAKIYLDFGGDMGKIDQSIRERLKQQIGAELQKHLPQILEGRMNTARTHFLLTEAVKKSLAPYKIELTSLKITNQDNPQIAL